MKVKPYKIQKAHDLTPKQQQVRLQRAKDLHQEAAPATGNGLDRCNRRWALCNRFSGVKVNAQYYRESILEAALKSWADKHFGCKPWTFQQDAPPSYKARVN